MNHLSALGAVASMAAALASSVSLASPEHPAFAAKTVAAARAALGVTVAEPTVRVRVESPDIVDASSANGARVVVKVTSAIPGTDWIAIFVEPAAKPLVAFADVAPGAKPVLAATVPVKRTAAVRVVVRASGKYYQISREIKAADKGCGE